MRLAGVWYIDANSQSTKQSKIINATGIRYPAELFEDLLTQLPSAEPQQVKKLGPSGRNELYLREIAEVLDCVPTRAAGSGTCGVYKNVLWGPMAACREVGR